MAKAPAGPRNLEDAVLAATEPMRVMHTLSGQAARAMAAQGPDHYAFTPQPVPPAYPMPADYDDASLLVDCDRLAEIGSPLAEALKRLPTTKPRQVGEVINTLVRDTYLRCVGGEYNNTFAMEGLPARAATRTEAPWDTHHYVEHTATWNGLTLRWYEWEPRHAQP